MKASFCGRRALPWVLATLVALVAAWAAAPTARAESPGAITIVSPAPPVANSCTGDSVALTGNMVTTIQTTVSESGNTIIHTTVDFTAVTGTSILTGKKFRSDSQSSSMVTLAPSTSSSSIFNGRFIVSGESAGINLADPGDDFFSHATVHTTLNANGVPTAFVDNVRFGCQ